MKKFFPYIFLLVCLLILGGVIFKVLFLTKKKPVTSPSWQIAAPTKTAQELKIISEIKTHKVLVSNQGPNPKTLEIKVHDQVMFFNQTNQTIKVMGEGWGDIPLKPSKNMTQSFDSAGTFSYKVTGLSSEIEGSILVK